MRKKILIILQLTGFSSVRSAAANFNCFSYVSLRRKGTLNIYGLCFVKEKSFAHKRDSGFDDASLVEWERSSADDD